MSLTPRQSSLLAAIVAHHEAHGYGPALRDLARAEGVSVARVRAVLAALERAGAVVRDESTARSIRPRVQECTPLCAGHGPGADL